MRAIWTSCANSPMAQLADNLGAIYLIPNSCRHRDSTPLCYRICEVFHETGGPRGWLPCRGKPLTHFGTALKTVRRGRVARCRSVRRVPVTEATRS